MKLTTVTSCPTADQADLIKNLLEAEGIPVYLENRNVIAMDWLLGVAVGDIKVKVPEPAAKEAFGILISQQEAIQAAAAKRHASVDLAPGEIPCLQCGKAIKEEADCCEHCGWTYLEE